MTAYYADGELKIIPLSPSFKKHIDKQPFLNTDRKKKKKPKQNRTALEKEINVDFMQQT